MLALVPTAHAVSNYKPGVAGALTYYSGAATGSLVGSSEKVLSLIGEKATGYLRLTVSGDFGLSSGDASIASSTYTYSMFTAALAPGVYVFPFKESSFQPFVGVKGVIGLHRFSMSSPPTGFEESGQGYHYGYETSIGTDLRFSKGNKGTAFRFAGSIRKVSGNIGASSGFDFGGFRYSFGLIF